MEKIRIKNLTFRYPLGRQNTLEKIDLSVGEADFVVVCGKSGCGKTTLLRQMKKSLAPYGERSGEILYAGDPLEELDARRDAAEIGFVLQNPESQLVTDKVWHELAFGLENLGLPRREIQRRVAEMASYFGIHGWFRKDVSELSGGQKQMLNLASVMAMQPQILILDEPTSQLDPIAATDFLSMLHRIHRDFGTTIILSEHNLEEAFPLATQAVVLEDGRIAAQGSPSEIGRALARGDGKEPHPMYFGMPAPMRVIPEPMAQGRELPLTIREGRLLLEEILASPDIEKKETRLLPHEKEEATASRGEGDACIQLRDVWFRYDRASEPVLRGLDMEVASGEIYCLLGGNGSGKTTTIKALAGLLRPQRGKIKIREGARTALVPQDPMALFTEITVEEEVLEGMADLHGAQRMSDEEKIDRVEEMLRLMEIEHLRKANSYDLSGGEQQRLAIAKVMACAPDILLLDEPTKGLDPFFKRTLGELLQQLAAGGTTVLLVSHDVDFCASYGHTCALFFDGQITAAGEAGEFFRGNNYYTTSANKMVRRWRPDIVLVEEARAWLEELL